MRITANYHTHTRRCGHAKGEDREYIENAIASGIKELGFSDHSPMLFPSGHRSGFRVPPEEAADYFESLTRLREEYKDHIRIYIGVEAEYYPETFAGYLAYMSQFPLDYKIMGQHFLWREEDGIGAFAATEDPARLQSYYENVLAGVTTGEFLYIAHPDVLHFTGDEAAYRELTADFLRRVKPLGLPLEINRLGLFDGRHYPRRAFWELCGQMDVPAVIGLDAHDPAVLLDETTADACVAFAESCGVRVLPRLEIGR